MDDPRLDYHVPCIMTREKDLKRTPRHGLIVDEWEVRVDSGVKEGSRGISTTWSKKGRFHMDIVGHEGERNGTLLWLSGSLTIPL